MKRSYLISVFFLFAFVACSTALAQRQAYVATHPGEGEANPIYLMLHLDATGSHMVDTLWFRDPGFGPSGPLNPPKKPAKVWALFRGDDARRVHVPTQHVSRDSVSFHSARFTDESGWTDFNFAGKWKGKNIQGTLVQRTFFNPMNRMYADTCRLSFQKAGVAK